MRRGGAHKRRDATEPAIIEALRQVGAFVQQCHGDNAPDLIVKWRNTWLPIEVKAPGGKVRPRQGIYPLARTPAEALELFGLKGTA